MELSPVKLDVKADATPLATELAKLVSDIRKGSHKIISLLLPERLRQRLQKRELADAQHVKNVHDVCDGVAIYDDKGEELKYILSRTIKEREMVNLLRISNLAAAQLNDVDDSEIDDNSLSNDFFNRWRREAELIEDSEMQIVWARLMAEEVKKQGTVSLRAMEMIKTMTGEEARSFSPILRSCLNGMIIAKPTQGSVMREPVISGISHQMLLTLEEIGLIANVADLGLHWSIALKGKRITLPHDSMSALSIEGPGDLKLTCFIRLTPTGVLLSKIAEPKHDINDVFQIAKSIAVGNPQLVFSPTIYTQTAKN